MALPEHGPMALLWPSPARMGGGRQEARAEPCHQNAWAQQLWQHPQVQQRLSNWTATAIPFCLVQVFCFYFLILFSSAFLEVWWEEKDCTRPGAELKLQRGNPSFRSNACICHSENYFYLPINFMLTINKETGLCVGSAWYFPAFTNIVCFLYLPPCISRCGLFTLGY